MSSDRDLELEKLLSRLKTIEASESQIQSWQDAVQSELWKPQAPRNGFYLWTGQVAAALIVGFLLGAFAFPYLKKQPAEPEPVATIQYIFSKAQ